MFQCIYLERKKNWDGKEFRASLAITDENLAKAVEKKLETYKTE